MRINNIVDNGEKTNGVKSDSVNKDCSNLMKKSIIEIKGWLLYFRHF